MTATTPATTIPVDLIITIIVFAVVISGLFYWCAMHPYKPPKNYWFYGNDNDDKELPDVLNEKGDK